MSGKDFETYVNDLAKARKKLNEIFNTNDYKDTEDGVDGLSKASNAYLKILDGEIKGLEAKRDAQKNSNDETQRQIDLQMKLKDLDNQAVLAKISGDYLKAATLQQQAQNLQMEFNQDTEIRKKDAEIARLKSRAEAIRGGAPTTKAEDAKVTKKLKKASGGMIRGAGTATSDSIPALLSNGEYVIKADSVKKYGVGTLDALNAGRFANGGLVPGFKDGGSAKDGFMQKWSKSISGSPLAEMLGTAHLLRLISGQGKKGDNLGAAKIPLSLLGSGLGSKIMGNLGKSAFYLPNKINQMLNQRKVNSMIKSGVFHGSQPVGHRGEEYLQGTNILDGSMSTDPHYGMGFFGTTSKSEARLYASGYNSPNNWGESFGSMNQIIGAPRGKYVDFTRGPKSLKWQDYGLSKAIGKSMPENLGDLMNAQGLTGGIMNRVSSGRAPEDIMYAKWLAFSNAAGVMTKELGYKDGGLASRPKYGKKQNAFQRYVANLTKAHDESPIGGDPLGVVAMLRKFAGQGRKGDSLSAALMPLNFMGIGLGKTAPALSASKIEKLTSKWTKPSPYSPATEKYDWTNTDPLHGPLFIGKADIGSEGVRRSLSYSIPSKRGGKQLVGISPQFSNDPRYLIERYMAGDKAVLARMQYEAKNGLNSHPLSIQSLFKSVATPYRGKLYRGMTSQSVADTLPKHIVEAIQKARETGDFSALVGKDFIMRRASFSSDKGIASFFAPGYGSGPYSSLLLEASLFGRKVTPTSKMFPDKKFMAPYGQKSAQRYRSELESLVGGKFIITEFDGKTLKVDQKAKGGLVKKYAMGGLIKGPGTGKSDSIRATLGYAGGGSIRVSNGEYVVNASSVKDYGVKTMDAINNGSATVSTNSGGTVYNINMPVTSNNANAEGVANEVIRKLKLEVSKNNKSNKVGL
jgi:hypothetical protein